MYRKEDLIVRNPYMSKSAYILTLIFFICFLGAKYGYEQSAPFLIGLSLILIVLYAFYAYTKVAVIKDGAIQFSGVQGGRGWRAINLRKNSIRIECIKSFIRPHPYALEIIYDIDGAENTFTFAGNPDDITKLLGHCQNVNPQIKLK